MSATDDCRQLQQLLEQTQLESFNAILRQQLQITHLSHFDYVKAKDLEKIGMSKPAVRRLLVAVQKSRTTVRPSAPVRPAPPPPVPHDSTRKSKLYNLTRRFSSSSSQQQEQQQQNDSPSVIINANNITYDRDANNKNDVVLGTGHFGVVKKAVWTKPNGEKVPVAVKCLHNEHETSTMAVSELLNEISLMCGLEHKSLVRLYGIVLQSATADTDSGGVLMVTELAPLGSLLKHLRDSQMLPVDKLYSYVYQVVCGMEYLESHKLIHRDLAARNLLIFTTEQIKICDFGMTRSVKHADNGLYMMRESHKIPCAWYPPESIRHKVFSHKSDVWTFGVTAWEIFTHGEHPWPNMNAIQILNKIDEEGQRLKQPHTSSNNFYLLLKQCWSKEPSDRPSFQVLRSLIKQIKVMEMKAKTDYSQEGRLQIKRGDTIFIIESEQGKYWWKGQNTRTMEVGYFPRTILDSSRPLNSNDISLPVKNSFVHTGHMGIDRDKVWGNPGKIDENMIVNQTPDLLTECIDNKPKKEGSSSGGDSSDEVVALPPPPRTSSINMEPPAPSQRPPPLPPMPTSTSLPIMMPPQQQFTFAEQTVESNDDSFSNDLFTDFPPPLPPMPLPYCPPPRSVSLFEQLPSKSPTPSTTSSSNEPMPVPFYANDKYSIIRSLDIKASNQTQSTPVPPSPVVFFTATETITIPEPIPATPKPSEPPKQHEPPKRQQSVSSLGKFDFSGVSLSAKNSSANVDDLLSKVMKEVLVDLDATAGTKNSNQQ